VKVFLGCSRRDSGNQGCRKKKGCRKSTQKSLMELDSGAPQKRELDDKKHCGGGVKV